MFQCGDESSGRPQLCPSGHVPSSPGEVKLSSERRKRESRGGAAGNKGGSLERPTRNQAVSPAWRFISLVNVLLGVCGPFR